MQGHRSRRSAGRVVLAAALISGSATGCTDRAPTAPAAVPLASQGRTAGDAQALAAAVDDARHRLIPALANDQERGALNVALTRLSDAVRMGHAAEMRAAVSATESTLFAVGDGDGVSADLEAIRLVLEHVREAAQ